MSTSTTGKTSVSRRDFVKAAAVAGAALSTVQVMAQPKTGRVFKIALIGSGGRGSGAIQQHVDAAKLLNDKLGLGIEIKPIAIADWSKGRAEGTGKKFGLGPEACFGGADGYKKVLELKPDTVLMAQPPLFRPMHFEACINAGCHVFFEKPSAVDPVGCRRVIAAGEKAKEKGLFVVAGTQRRHEKGYLDQFARIQQGIAGKVVAGRVSWCQGGIFSNTPINPTKPDDIVGGGKWQLWIEGSGDHICEQHVHNLDVANWFIGSPPVSAAGFGWRARRKAGNMYDFFSIDFEYPNGVYVHSMCRQVEGCWSWVGEQFNYDNSGSKDKEFKSLIPEELAKAKIEGNGGHYQEHINMLYYMVKGQYLNEAKNVAESTAAAVMGREAAYTGKRITWNEMMVDPKKSPAIYNLQLKPTAEDFETGDIVYPKDGDIRIPGR